MGMTNRDWLFSLPLEEQIAWMESEHSEPNPDCSAMLYKLYTENMKHEPCSDYEPNPEGDALGWLRKWNAGHDPQLRGHGLAGLETIADVIERDYVRRESIEEVMDNDRALVEENSMLARELLKLRAELEKATNNLNSANEDFENARAELTAERDEIAELVGWHGEADGNSGRPLFVPMVAAMCEGSDVAEKLQAKVNELTADNDRLAKLLSKSLEEYSKLEAERDNLKANNEQLHTLAGEQAAMIDWLTAERDNLKDDLIDERGKLNRKMNALREVTRDYRNERDHYRSKFGKCIDYADAIHALMDDEGMA